MLLVFAYSVKSFTPPIFSTNSIADLRALDVNGDEQYLLLRGADRDQPVLLFVHGGPGMPAMYLAHDFQRQLEKHFVVVHWDQRSSGKSFKADASGDQLSTSQLLSDMDVVVDFLRDELSTDRLWLVGHSHGAYLAVLYARRHDDKVCAYVGVGQVTNDSATGPVYSLQREFLEARREELGLEPGVAIDRSNLEDLLFRTGSELYGETSFAPLLLSGLMATEYNLFDSLNVAKGSSFSSRHMRYDMPRDLLANEWQFNIPVALIMGRYDMVTPTQLAREYFEKIEAPAKAWLEFKETAHFPHFEQPQQFTAALTMLRESWGDCPHRLRDAVPADVADLATAVDGNESVDVQPDDSSGADSQSPPEADLQWLRKETTQEVITAYALMFRHLGLSEAEQVDLTNFLVEVAISSTRMRNFNPQPITEDDRQAGITAIIGDAKLLQLLELERNKMEYWEAGRATRLFQANDVPLTDAQQDQFLEILVQVRRQEQAVANPDVQRRSVEYVENRMAEMDEYERLVLELSPSVLSDRQMGLLFERYQAFSYRRAEILDMQKKTRANETDDDDFPLVYPARD